MMIMPKKTAGPSFKFAGGGIYSSSPRPSGEPSVKKVIKKPAAVGGNAGEGGGQGGWSLGHQLPSKYHQSL